jgi:AhpD family alkylhydroperoxidase
MTVHLESDMPDTMADLREGIHMMRNASPEVWSAWANFIDAALAPVELDRKTKEFVALGMSITAQCKYCVGIHTQKCLDAGATDKEIVAVCQVAMAMGGSPAMTYVAEVNKAMELYHEKQEQAG